MTGEWLTAAVRLVLLTLSLIAGATPVWADWIVSPFLGVGFNGTTTFIDLENGAGETKLTFGGSGGWLSDGLLGVEINVGYTPGFFDTGDESRDAELVLGSSVTAVTGDLLVLVPRAVLRDSLRPYVLGGVGLLRLRSDDIAEAFPISSNLLGLALGGGAFGRLTELTSLRFELRRISNLTRDDTAPALAATSLTFWRATIGVLISY